MTMILTEILILLALIVANGIFAMSEIALVSARETRLSQLADRGSRGAQAALDLMESPERFLATIQIGISLIAIASGAYGKATLSERLEPVLADVPALAAHSDGFAAAIVVLGITYLSLVVGELAPKELGLGFSEALAAVVGLPMKALSIIAAPAVAFLNASTTGFLRLFGIRASDGETVTRSELRLLIEDWAEEGVISDTEEEMGRRLLALVERDALSVGTPRPRIRWLDANASQEEIAATVLETGYDMLPVCDGTLERPLGVVRSNEVLTPLVSGAEYDIRDAMQEPLFVPASSSALSLLEAFQEGRPEMALLVDDYGDIEGLATPLDLVQAVLGSLAELGSPAGAQMSRRDDGTWLVDGMTPLEEFEATFEVEAPPEIKRSYSTVAGLLIGLLKRFPTTGSRVRCGSLELEVMDMDGRRIDKVLVSPAPQDTPEPDTGGPEG
ncbi:MAG: hemolysin family protein [Armatimonadota bacterium]|nr:hemolysin family protein [Armatimonadota bacterium]